MPLFKCKVKEEWLQRKDPGGHPISVWASKANDTDIFCKICSKTLSCDKKGFQAVTQHYESAVHLRNSKTKIDTLQLRLTTDPPDSSEATSKHKVTLYSPRNAAIKAEITWCLKSVIHNYSCASSQDIAEVFRAMFPDGVPHTFSLNPTKQSYIITDGLGPYFRQMVLNDCETSFYTLSYDETTNNESKKELQMAIRYWSDDENQIVTRHLETCFIGAATAEDIVKWLLKGLDNANLPIVRLLMLGSDGPNVNKKVFRLINEQVKLVRQKSLLDIGTCNLHVAHNAFSKGLEVLGQNVGLLAVKVYYYFDGWPKRWEDFKKVQKECEVPHHRFIKHVPSRWLTLQSAALRLLEQWKALCYYFLKEVPKKKITLTKHGNEIVSILNESTMVSEICFVIDSAELFQNFKKFYQRTEPLIHLLYDELRLLISTVVGRIYEPDAVKNFLSKDDPFSKENLCPETKITCSTALTNALNRLPEADRIHFQKRAQNHYLTAAKYLYEKSCLSVGTTAKFFKCLSSTEITKKESIRSIQKVARALPLEISTAKLSDEWNLLGLEKLCFKNNQRIDHFWRDIMELKTSCGDRKYPILTSIVKAVLSLSHGSADVERGFSASSRILTEDKASMSLRMLNARLYIKDAMMKYENKPHLVPISNELILAVQCASQKYKLFLESERQKTEDKLNEKRKKEEEINRKRKLQEEMTESKKRLKILEDDYKKAEKDEQEQRKLADRLFEEANERLKKAVKKGDMADIKIAQSMLDTSKQLRKDEEEKMKIKKEISKKVEKKKSYLLTKIL